MKPGKNQRSKQRYKGPCRKVHDHAQSFVLRSYTMYVTNAILLVSSSVSSKQLLCFAQGQRQKKTTTHTTENFVEFHNNSPLLTMMRSCI